MKFLFLLLFIIPSLSAYDVFKEEIIFGKSHQMDLIPLLKDKILNSEWEIKNTLKLKIRHPFYYSKKLKLYINCENEIAYLLQDVSGNSEFLEKNIFIKEHTQNFFYGGTYSCFFRNRENRILLKNAINQLDNLTEISFAFWFFPIVDFENQILFQRVNYFEKEPKVFSIRLNKKRIIIEIRNIIQDKSGYRNIYLETRKSLDLRKWNHLMLSISLRKGLIYLFLNQEILIVHQFQQIQNIHSMKFFENEHSFISPFQIGGNFIGEIDEIYVIQDFFEKPYFFHQDPLINSGRVYLKEEELVLPVIHMGSLVKSVFMNINFFKPEGTQIRFYYRTSDSKNNLSQQDWSEIANQVEFYRNQNLKQYFQIRIVGWRDISGTQTPEILNLILKKQEYELPQAPINLKIVRELSSDHQICLQWEKIPDEIIEEIGGYKIHIGLNQSNFDITLDEVFRNQNWIQIRKKNLDFPLTDDEKLLFQNRPLYMQKFVRNHIRVCLSNEDLFKIYEKKLERNLLHKNRIPLIFEKNRVYYFAVSSYIVDKLSAASPISNKVPYNF